MLKLARRYIKGIRLDATRLSGGIDEKRIYG
jgi:hypothetical protein